jgi:hypothetical protein
MYVHTKLEQSIITCCTHCIAYGQHILCLTFMGPCIANIFQYISNKMQRYTVYLYLETDLHVSGFTSTHYQEGIQLYLQHLVFVTPLLLPVASWGSWNSVTNTKCCRYSCMRSWWWVEVTPESCRALSRYKPCKVASCWIYIGIYFLCLVWQVGWQQTNYSAMSAFGFLCLEMHLCEMFFLLLNWPNSCWPLIMYLHLDMPNIITAFL